jgi:hypothetical protein
MDTFSLLPQPDCANILALSLFPAMPRACGPSAPKSWSWYLLSSYEYESLGKDKQHWLLNRAVARGQSSLQRLMQVWPHLGETGESIHSINTSYSSYHLSLGLGYGRKRPKISRVLSPSHLEKDTVWQDCSKNQNLRELLPSW